MIEKRRSGMPRAVFFKYKKTIVLPVLSGVPLIAPVLMRFQIINMMLVCLFIICKLIRIGEIDGTPVRTGKTIVFLYSKTAALGMPDGHFSIIGEKLFFNLNL